MVLPGLRQGDERALETRHRLPVRRALGGDIPGDIPGLAEMDNGLVPHFALAVVKAEGEVVRLQIMGV